MLIAYDDAAPKKTITPSHGSPHDETNNDNWIFGTTKTASKNTQPKKDIIYRQDTRSHSQSAM